MFLFALLSHLFDFADTTNGFCFHPSLPLAVTTSGHRRYMLDDEDSEEKNLSGINY